MVNYNVPIQTGTYRGADTVATLVMSSTVLRTLDAWRTSTGPRLNPRSALSNVS